MTFYADRHIVFADLLLVPRRARAMDVLTMTTKYGERRDEFHATHVLDNVSDLRQRHALFDVTLKAGSLQVSTAQCFVGRVSEGIVGVFENFNLGGEDNTADAVFPKTIYDQG